MERLVAWLFAGFTALFEAWTIVSLPIRSAEPHLQPLLTFANFRNSDHRENEKCGLC